MRGPSPQRGATLVEVLVALVVVALGVLSLTALQLVGKRNTLDAAQHGDAALLANNLLERMRGNASTAALSAYLNAASVGLGNGAQAGAPACSKAVPCTAAQLAQHDLEQWERLLDGLQEQLGEDITGGLDDGRACLQGPAGGGTGLYTLTLVWRGGVAIPDSVEEPACGRDLGLYGDNNELRRTLRVQTFIAATG